MIFFLSKKHQKSKTSKSHFFRKTTWFSKNMIFEVFFRKSDFSIFPICSIVSKNIFHRKNMFFHKMLFFFVLSYLMSNLCEWHHATPTVPPVGGGKRPPENPKNQENSPNWWFFDDFSTKNVAGFAHPAPSELLRSGFEARPTSNGPSSELKRSYEDFCSITLRN